VEPNDDAPRFEPIDRQQVVLEPLDVELLIPPSHPARNIWDLLGGMDLSGLSAGIKSTRGHAGRSAWDPRVLIAIRIDAYSRGISSAREIDASARTSPPCPGSPPRKW
jgi:transposase